MKDQLILYQRVRYVDPMKHPKADPGAASRTSAWVKDVGVTKRVPV